MVIKRFNEADMSDISTDRSLEIVESLSQMSRDISKNLEELESIVNELENFRSKSGTNNDQIDDSVSNLEITRNSMKEFLTKIDNASISLKDYVQNGRKYLY